MQLEVVEYVIVGGLYPGLRLVVDGRETVVDPRMSQAVRDAGYVLLGEAFDDLPVATLPPDPAVNRHEPTPLRGATDDPAILTAFDFFRTAVRQGTFTGRSLTG